MLPKVNIGQKYHKRALLGEKGLKLKTLILMRIYISILFHIYNLYENLSNGLGGVAIRSFFS